VLLGGIEADRAEHVHELGGADLPAVVGVEDGELGLDLLEPLLADLLLDQALELCGTGRKGSGRRSALVNQVECRGGSTTERARGVRGKDTGSHLVDLALFLGILPGLTPEETPEAEAQHAGLHTRASWSGERPSQNCRRTRRKFPFIFTQQVIQSQK